MKKRNPVEYIRAWRDKHPKEYHEAMIKGAKETFKITKASGLKNWRKNNPELASKIPSETAKKTHKKYPHIGKNLAQWNKDHPESCGKTARLTHRKYPKMASERMKKTHRDWKRNNPEGYKQHYIKNRLRFIEWRKNNPNLVKKAISKGGKNSHKKHPNQRYEMALKGNEVLTQKGFISKPEKIMRKLLPKDFIHGKRLGRVGVPDFHSPERKIVIEVDGIYWHSKPKAIKKDKGQTKYWQKMGYQVFRITDKDVNKYMKPLLIRGGNHGI